MARLKVLKHLRDSGRIYIADDIIEVNEHEAVLLFDRFPDIFEPSDEYAERALSIVKSHWGILTEDERRDLAEQIWLATGEWPEE